jgi:ribosomal protein RSM22 (predicted rRNA methylase)
MKLPSPLRAAVDRALEEVAPSELMSAAQILSARYRAEVRDGRPHLSGRHAALAYLGTRLPATYAAIRRSLDAVAVARPDFAPSTALDAGAGPGTALWAASDCWPNLSDALLVEAGPAIRALGEKLAADATYARIMWSSANLTSGLPDIAPRDLVTLGYVLDELEAAQRDALVDRLWALTAGILVIVEPGTPAGYRRILRARERLIAAGAAIVAPCPHAKACPLIEPDWCHFAERVERSRVHRLLKQGDVPWEDEKFSYVAVARNGAAMTGSRVLSPPQSGSGRVTLKLCQPDGTVQRRMVTRREGDAFKAARRADWGDVFDPETTA